MLRKYDEPWAAYRPSYHRAIEHLIEHGTYLYTRTGRYKIARALRELRQQFGRERALRERNHLRQICGAFPTKKGQR